IGALGVGLGSWLLSTKPDLAKQPLEWGAGVGMVVGGGVDLLLGTFNVLRRSKGERIFAEFEKNLARPNVDQRQVVAQTEQQLFRLYHEERKDRRMTFVLSWVLAGVGSLGLGLSAIPSNTNSSTVSILRVSFALCTGLGISTGI